MSFKAIEWAFGIEDLTPVERLVLVYLAKGANSKNQCWPSIRTIIHDCEVGNGSVYRALDKLRQRDLISVEPRKSKTGRHTSPVYTLKLHRGHSHVGKENSQHGKVFSQGGSIILESSLNPLLNPNTAHDQTVSAVDPKSEYSDFEQEVTKPLKFEFKVEGAPLTPEMKTAGVTGVAFQTLDDLINYGPLLGVPVNLDDILHLHQKSLTVEQAISKARNGKKSYTALGLAGLWRDLNIIHNPGVFQKALTLKESGQLAWLGKSLAEIDVGRVMATVFQDWINFGKFLKDQGIVQDFPDKPNIGFFLKHGGMAFEFSKKLSTPAVSGGLKPFDPNE